MGVILQLSEKLLRFINKGSARSAKAKKNILASFLIKGLSILISFILVPLTIDYISKEQYGIWLVLSSIITWFRFFNVGLGNGLRNRFAEALAKDEIDKARTYVSTTYAVLTLIIAGLVILFLAVNPFISWAKILNASDSFANELQFVVMIVFSFFCINFVLKLLNSVVTANQQPSLVGGFNLTTNVLSLLIIFILTKTTEGSLTKLAWVMSITPFVVLTTASIILYSTRYKKFAPSIKFIDFSYVKDLMSLGVKFFVIQIVGIVLFSTDNIIITQLYGPAEVTPYNIAYKYFGIITTGFAIICTPFWSAYTDAYHRNDISWIKRVNKKLRTIWLGFSVLALFLLVISNFFYGIWVPTVEVDFFLSCFMCLYVIFFNWNSIYVLFVNGVGKVTLQLVFAVLGGILNIPLSILFAKTFGMGPAGVILATTISIWHGGILMPIQYKKILNNTAKGIWNK